MCCFSRAVRHVGDTQIFARAVAPTRQALVYAMSVTADEDLAMVLPLPVPPGASEDAVAFVSLEDYPHFFGDLRKAFPDRPRWRPPTAKRGARRGGVRRLAVVDVGQYEASFVPRLADFSRLDPRFAPPPATWNKLSDYRDWGFAVFRLRGFAPPPAAPRAAPVADPPAARSRAFHPMALTFPRRDTARLFFPTVHVHDGVVHPTAYFDHALYLQQDAGVRRALPGWRRSARAARAYVRVGDARRLVDPERTLRQTVIRGEKPNRDVWVDA